MNSKTKLIVIIAIVVALLAGAMVALKLTEPADNNDSSSSSMESKLLYDKNPEDVNTIKVFNSFDTFTVTNNGGKYIIEGYEDFPLNEEYVSALVRSVSSVTALKVVEENVDDMSKYGLDDNAPHVEVTFNDSAKTVKKFKIGTETFTYGKSYFAFDGENTVYSVDTMQFRGVTQSKTNTLSYTLLEKPESDDKYPIVDKITIEKSKLDYPIVVEYDKSLVDENKKDFTYDNEHILTSPIKQRLSKDVATLVVRGLFGMSASSIYAVNPTEEDLAHTGLNEPLVSYSIETEGKTYSLYLGNPVEGTNKTYCYGRFEGRDIIYMFDNTNVAFAQASAESLVSKSVTIQGIYDLSKIQVITDKENMTFDLEGTNDENFETILDGEEFDKSLLQSFYYFFTKTPCNDLYLEEPTTDTLFATMILTDKLGNETVIEYYDNGYRKSVIKVNGKSAYTTDTSYVERFIANVTLLKNKEAIVSEW